MVSGVLGAPVVPSFSTAEEVTEAAFIGAARGAAAPGAAAAGESANVALLNCGFPNCGFPNCGLPNWGFPNCGFPNCGLPNWGAETFAVWVSVVSKVGFTTWGLVGSALKVMLPVNPPGKIAPPIPVVGSSGPEISFTFTVNDAKGFVTPQEGHVT